MSDTIFRGIVSFINYEKRFATIDYEKNGKKKDINCKIDDPVYGKKPHNFRMGDTVSFELKLSDRGDKQTAHNVKFLYNTALDQLLNKATTENRFSGYLKKTDDAYFVKEWESYIFFPLQVSPWETPPAESAGNEAISFKLINLDKPNAIAAELFSHSYIPEYRKALQHFTHQIDIDAEVTKLTPHAIYLNLFGDRIQGKLPLEGVTGEFKPGDRMNVIITHISNTRIVVKQAQPANDEPATQS